MALNTIKPGLIGEIDRGLAADLGLVALFLFQEQSGFIRDSVTKAGVALSSGGVAIDQPGRVLTFNGSQAQNLAFTLPVPGSGALPGAAQNFVIMARFKPTAAPAATPGQIFGICASSGTQGAFGVGTDTSNNVGQTWLSGSGASIGASSPGSLNNWYTVYAALGGTNGASQYAWINGAPATANQGSATSSGGSGTMNEVAFGAQHRSSGFLRNAKGNLEWAAILYGVTMTDALAEDLFAAEFPYNLLIGTRKRLWKSSGISAVNASFSETLPPPTSSSTGAVEVSGSVAAQLAAPTPSATASVLVSASLTQSLPAPIASATAEAIISASVAASLDAPTCAASGTVEISGSLSTTAPGATPAATGTVGDSRNAALAVTLPAPTLSAAGEVIVGAQAAAQLPGVTASAAGTVIVLARAAVTLANVQAVVAGAPVVNASLAATLPAPTCIATGITGKGYEGVHLTAQTIATPSIAGVTLSAPTVTNWSIE